MEGVGNREWRTHGTGVVLWDFVSCVVDERVREVALLVDDALEVSFVVRERRLRLLREALDPAERRVLDEDLRREVRHDRVVVAGIQDEGDVCSACVAH